LAIAFDDGSSQSRSRSRSLNAIPTHELEHLMTVRAKLALDIPTDVRSDARSVDKFYVSTRYPDALGFADAALAYQVRDADTAMDARERATSIRLRVTDLVLSKHQFVALHVNIQQ
jgi:hypothetical protein